MAQVQTNTLYLAVLPFIHISSAPFTSVGQTEQVLTVFPDRDWATKFFADEVDGYMKMFKSRAEKFPSGGHVLGDDLHPIPTDAAVVRPKERCYTKPGRINVIDHDEGVRLR